MKKTLLNLRMAVIGLGLFISTAANAATFTAVVSGNWSSAATWGGTAPTGTVSNDNIVIPSGLTVTMDMDVTFTGNLILPNTFNVNGTLTNTTNNWLTITQGALTGSGTVSIKRVNFTNTGTSAFTGTMNVGILNNSASTLGFVAIANVSDSLILESGILTLNNTSNLSLLANATIRVNSGSLTNSGGVFGLANSYNVMYVGSSKTTGLELSGTTVQNIWVKMSNNTQSVTLNTNFTVNGNLTFNNGKMNLNGKKLTLKGDLNMSSSNAFVSNSTSEMVIEGSGALTSGLMFDAGSSINNMTVNRSGSTVKLMSALNIAGHLNLMSGTYSIENGSALTMNAGSTVHIEGGTLANNSGSFIGTASYDVEYMGSSNSTTGTELNGSGLHDLTVNYTAGTSKTTLNGNATVSGQLKLMSGNLDLNGKNLTLNGTMSQVAANSKFVGNASSELSLNLTAAVSNSLSFDQSNNNLSKLKLNLGGSASSSVTLMTALKVMNELDMTAGRMMLGSGGDLMIAASGSITGYNDQRYIMTGSGTGMGRLQMNITSGSTAWVTFPVGTEDSYSPAYIQQTSAGTTGDFMVRTANEMLADGTTGIDLSTSMSVVKRTWHIESATGTTVDMNLKLGWKATAEMNGFNRNSSILRHYTNSAWDISGVVTASAGANSTFETSRNGITSLSPFAISDASAPVSIKKQVASTLNFDVYPNPAREAVSVKAPATGEFKYEMLDITGRTLFTAVNSENVNKFDTSKLEKGYYFVKITNLETNVTGAKRFIKD